MWLSGKMCSCSILQGLGTGTLTRDNERKDSHTYRKDGIRWEPSSPRQPGTSACVLSIAYSVEGGRLASLSMRFLLDTKRKRQLLVFDNTSQFLIHTRIPTSEKNVFAFLLSLEHMCDGFARFLCVLEFSTQLCPRKQYISTPDCRTALTRGSLHSLSLPLFYFFSVQDGSSWLGKGRGVLQCQTPDCKDNNEDYNSFSAQQKQRDVFRD